MNIKHSKQLHLIILIIGAFCVMQAYENNAGNQEKRPILKSLYPPVPINDPNSIEHERMSSNFDQANNQQNQKASNKVTAAPLPPIWLLESSLKNAPKLLKGICFYLQVHFYTDRLNSTIVPSFHRFVLVGPPGTGKTTLAYAIGHLLQCRVIFIPASSFLGKYRNETSVKIRSFLHEQASDKIKKIIIIDEIHKLFEYHANEGSDHSQSAATFWLSLDFIEKNCPHIIVIGTANNVDKLPPEIKSRFSGRVIHVPLPDKNQKIEAFKNSLLNDKTIVIDPSIDDVFIKNIIQQLSQCSLRDIQLIIDTAKMFNYARHEQYQVPLLLTKSNFENALKQLHSELSITQECFSDNFLTHLKKWGIAASVFADIITLTNGSADLFHKMSILYKKFI